MLPEDQRSTFISLYADAYHLAQAGRMTLGYVILDLGLDRAEQERRHGASWGEEVVGLYRQALRTYVERFGFPEPWPPPTSEGTEDLLVAAVLSGRVAVAAPSE
ncbi:MAG: hypothetical protein K0Q72_1095 [Armatimonadetes bacterium]|jgi:hypothetical protein|nr:hypothetical protein [Armatimonadota bacterium]